MGYYPLIFYSGKTHVIPESTSSGYLPPLILRKHVDMKNAFRFMGSSMNIDTLHDHFTLDLTEIPLDTPEMVYTFHMYLDMVTHNSDFSEYPGYKFHIMDFELISKTITGEEQLLGLTIFIEFYDINIQTVNGKRIHTGEMYIGVITQVNGSNSNTEWSPKYKVKSSDTQKEYEIFNKDDEMYPFFELNQFEYFQWLSPQPFSMKVTDLCNVLVPHGQDNPRSPDPNHLWTPR